MNDLSPVVLLFVVVPGFVADGAYRALHGAPKRSDIERTLRSVILSVVGLSSYLLVGALAAASVERLSGGRLVLIDVLRRPPYVPFLGQHPSDVALGFGREQQAGSHRSGPAARRHACPR